MDTASLESAYERILELAAAGEFRAAGDGWSAEMVLAHLTVNDGALVSAVRDVLAGKPTHYYDNNDAVDDERLEGVATSLPELIDKLRTSSRQLCDLAGQLGPREDTEVNVTIKDGDATVVDGQAWPIGRLLEVHRDMHLPGHLSQLEELRS